VFLRPGETVPLQIERSSQTRTIQVKLGVDEEVDRFGQKYRRGLLGVTPAGLVYERPSAFELIPAAASYTWDITRTTLDALWQMLSGRRSVKELGGFLKIAQVAGQQASTGPIAFISLIALLSINLGFINLLPVPMLDGGHLLFYSIEAVQQRPVSARAQDWAFRGGLAVILALFLFTTVNDLGSFGLWERLGRLIG
jgi:regulator of sigma E protease